jgi:hypothetical protein
MAEKGETKIIAIFTICIMLISIGLSGCVEEDGGDWDEVYYYELRDAYCDLNSNFTFTLENFDHEPMEIKYEWNLKNPDSKISVFSGKGNITLEGDEIRILSFKIENKTHDARYYIICIDIDPERGDSEPFEIQKSPDEWDYTNLPPKKI